MLNQHVPTVRSRNKWEFEQMGRFAENALQLFREQMGIRTNGKTFSAFSVEKTKWEGLRPTFLVSWKSKQLSRDKPASTQVAKTSLDSDLHISAFHANFRLKSYTVPPEVVLTQLISEQTVAWPGNPFDRFICQN